MTEISHWFERKFTFDFPVEMYPNLRVRLGGTPARVEEMVRGLGHEALTRKPEGKWSILENIGHLFDAEDLWYGRVDEFLRGEQKLAAADLKNTRTHGAGHNMRPATAVLQEFRVARVRLVRWLEGLKPADFARTALHPRLNQPMRLVDHMYFIAEHDDHHLARIAELREEAAHGR